MEGQKNFALSIGYTNILLELCKTILYISPIYLLKAHHNIINKRDFKKYLLYLI